MKFVFERVQRGYWGSTSLQKSIVVEGADYTEAFAKVVSRKDAVKRLKNGDTLFWHLKVNESDQGIISFLKYQYVCSQ